MIHADVRGEIRVDGQLLRAIDLAQLSALIGLVQQDPDAQVCTLRVRSEVAFGPENLCLPLKDIELRVANALKALGIAQLADRDTTSLSGGEKQRLAVAAILAMQPSVILLALRVSIQAWLISVLEKGIFMPAFILLGHMHARLQKLFDCPESVPLL